jgi:hypothetical protein
MPEPSSSTSSANRLSLSVPKLRVPTQHVITLTHAQLVSISTIICDEVVLIKRQHERKLAEKRMCALLVGGAHFAPYE